MGDGDFMLTSEKIKILMIRRNITLKELAQKTDTTPQNLSNKLKRDNFNEKELLQIASALDCDFESHFVFKDTHERL